MALIEKLILDAWTRLSPTILKDPQQLHRRLARRRRAQLTRPPRENCLVLKSTDRRIHEFSAMMQPAHAAKYRDPHRVLITKKLIDSLSIPFSIPGVGMQADKFDRFLGVGPHAFRRARQSGKVDVHYIKHLSGKRGRPVPLIGSPAEFNPCDPRLFKVRDPVMGNDWQMLHDFIPDDFQQWISREPTITLQRGHRIFGGWWWVCPACRRKVRAIYFPVRLPSVLEYHRLDPAETDADRLADFPSTFACEDCHNIFHTSSCNDGWWNYIVTQYSGGLLYGREVPRPSVYVKHRERNYQPQLNRKSPLRDKVRRRLLNGWTYQKIARDLGISRNCVTNHKLHIFRQEGVTNRHDLATKLGSPHAQPHTSRERNRTLYPHIQELILQNKGDYQIGRILGVSQIVITVARRNIFTDHNVTTPEALAHTLGVPFHPPPSRREQVQALHLQGQRSHEIAQTLGINPRTVRWHLKELRQANLDSSRSVSIPPAALEPAHPS